MSTHENTLGMKDINYKYNLVQSFKFNDKNNNLKILLYMINIKMAGLLKSIKK